MAPKRKSVGDKKDSKVAGKVAKVSPGPDAAVLPAEPDKHAWIGKLTHWLLASLPQRFQ